MPRITVDLRRDTSVVLIYSPLAHSLEIVAYLEREEPGRMIRVPVTVDTRRTATRAVLTLPEGRYTVEVPEEVTVEGRRYRLVRHEVR